VSAVARLVGATVSVAIVLTGGVAAQTTASVTGIVRNTATTTPVEFILVRVYTSGGSIAGSAEVDASGAYRVTGLKPGTYYIRTVDASNRGLINQCYNARPCAGYTGFYSFGAGFPASTADPVTLAAGQTFTANFFLEAGGAISGRVENIFSGQAPEIEYVVFYDGSGTEVGDVPAIAIVENDGNYSFKGLPSGRYFAVTGGNTLSQQIYRGRNCASACGAPWLLGDPITVVAGQTTSGINFSMTPLIKPPFGVLETPVGDSTPLQGSIAVTGWTLDDVGVQRVEIWRDLQPGETTPPFTSTASDPRNGKVFISNATFVDGARPDVEALYPGIPFKSRAGWGYLLLTWGLWNQGNGTYNLYAYGFDQDSSVATLGKKTIVVSNSTATKPFGSIDTPEIGGNASGPNFGWGLTPKVNGVATCKIQPSGLQVSIDSGPLRPVTYGADVRTDVAGTFTGFSNSAAAGGHYIFDWSTLPNGPHTIGWLITDDCNRADGVGSRFFNVTGGTSLVAAPQEFRLKAEASPDADFRLKAEAFPSADFRLKAEATQFGSVASAFRRKEIQLLLARGYGELPEIVEPGPDGLRTVELTQGGRIELRLPRGYETAHQIVGDERRRLPIGSSWDPSSNSFYWQPAPGFLGPFRLVFSSGSERISVRVVITP
jgi:hypothetical protein